VFSHSHDLCCGARGRRKTANENCGFTIAWFGLSENPPRLSIAAKPYYKLRTRASEKGTLQFRVFELDVEGAKLSRDISPAVWLAITNTASQAKRKAAGSHPGCRALKMSLDEKLDQLAEREDGEGTIAPERVEYAKAFQATISSVRHYAEQGYLIILREKRESHSAAICCQV
jgi:hypothetical protein